MTIQFKIAQMKKIWICLLLIPFLTTLSAFSQCEDGGIREIECVRDSILKIHRNDEFYLHIRFLPDVRVSIDDYVLTKERDKWTGKHFKTTFDPSPWMGTEKTPPKRIFRVSRIDDKLMPIFLKSIDVNRLQNFKNSDSISLDNSFLREGTNCYFIIICSKGKVRLIEYPVVKHYDNSKGRRSQRIYWRSKYLDNLIDKIQKAF
jgi:hypothetical protein